MAGTRTITELHLHHEGGGSEEDDAEDIERVALSRTDQRFSSIPYNAVVYRPVVEGDDADAPLPFSAWRLVEGRPLSLQPASIKGRNTHAAALVVAGHWHDQPLPWEAQDLVVAWCVWMCSAFGLTAESIHGHGELAPTLCPGYSVEEIRVRVRAKLT